MVSNGLKFKGLCPLIKLEQLQIRRNWTVVKLDYSIYTIQKSSLHSFAQSFQHALWMWKQLTMLTVLHQQVLRSFTAAVSIRSTMVVRCLGLKCMFSVGLVVEQFQPSSFWCFPLINFYHQPLKIPASRFTIFLLLYCNNTFSFVLLQPPSDCYEVITKLRLSGVKISWSFLPHASRIAIWWTIHRHKNNKRWWSKFVLIERK